MSRSFPRIKAVRAYVTEAKEGDQGVDCHDVNDKHWINGFPTPMANPMSVYPQYTVLWKSWGINALGTMVAEVEAENGECGVGITIGGEPGCYIVEKHLSRFVEGQDPRNVELMWDQMFRATLNYGRKGLAIHAISAVDLAIWDLLGKLRGEPVYAMLGGKVKERLPVYCTTARPDIAKNMGFAASKITCPYGPADGEEGFKKNVEFYKGWREKVGPDFPLMLDCYMALTPQYTVRLAKALEPLGLKWIEDYLPPDDYEGYEDVRKAMFGSKVLLTTGEHEYSRYGYQLLLKSRCVDILQPDISMLGGITEARRLVAMASAHNVMVIPHASSIYSYHLQYAFCNCPVAEFIDMSPEADRIVPYFGGLFLDEPLPVNGFIDLPDKPGFGVTLCKDTLRRPYHRSEDTSREQAELNINFKPSEKAFMPF
ncbi:uncharacterized protein LOC110459260 [Mizuhopecten yessoensis]|uniref:L-rhamnonate dehydratase n=1 Tax=Mizuhopecten yessoensis TaxID=6573 RepID=A0A210Q4X3_MIZYE|nr:uncharacterized protein LOC110459260 [Mizuhopecten yessoensis]OWF43765.1 L-rhamnonate dehydratase [Mizuhopecten yessoensis]